MRADDPHTYPKTPIEWSRGETPAQVPRVVCLLAGLLVYLLGPGGVGTAQAQGTVVLDLRTNLPEATLYADSLRLGTADRRLFLVPPGSRTLRLLPPGLDTWSVSPVSRSVIARAGDTLRVRLDFPYYYRVETLPFGASVTWETIEGHVRLGDTPLLYRTEEPLDGVLVVERSGYLPERIEPGRDVWNRYVLTLRPVGPEQSLSEELQWKPPVKRRRWVDVSLGVVALGAGALAVHYKFKADHRDDRYRETGDPALRDRIRAYDSRSTVALGVMQVSAGVLALRFVLR